MAARRPLSPISRRRGLTGGAATLALAGCGSNGPAPAAASGPPRKIRTCVHATNHASSPLFWQRFAPAGWTVDVKIATIAAEVQTGLEAGSLVFGLIGTYSTILAREQGGLQTEIIGMWARRGIGLAGRTGVVTDVASLKGRKIAVPGPGRGRHTLADPESIERVLAD